MTTTQHNTELVQYNTAMKQDTNIIINNLNNMSDYKLAKEIVNKLEIGGIETIDYPLNITAFRKYLSSEARFEKKKFTTKKNGDKLMVMRIKNVSVWDKIDLE